MKPVDKTLGLTAKRLREVLSYDLGSGVFIWIKKPHKSMSSVTVGDIAGSLDNTGYIRIWIDGKRYVAHRLAWLYVHGKWPNEQIDHRDGNRKNNRWLNLREATHQQNIVNRKVRKDSSSKILGVTEPFPGIFRARIQRNGKKMSLGLYKSILEAKKAYDNVSKEIDGEFARKQ